ncbi:MAG: DUF2905 family protein [Desulfohalobiaceae bacterium]
MSDWSKWLIILGALLIILGLGLQFLPRIPWLGRLPGDIVYEKKRIQGLFPLGYLPLAEHIDQFDLEFVAQIESGKLQITNPKFQIVCIMRS